MKWQERQKEWEIAVSLQKARIAELEEALRPFANQAHEGRDYERARKVLDHG